MNRKQIMSIIRELAETYIKFIVEKDWSMASDVHDEIRKWTEDLKSMPKI